ncbi:TrmB family transcriptional regulator [Halegenticoccus tardaugens]|uniref:TrmB family transcriptional regulator n=1 Tax=Halegenticoccus tardaugens TaxID=2071624 RepID=UPI001E2DFEE1|nr:TrmB family transcriptional regulator [Halegenticoccus tardaugens]
MLFERRKDTEITMETEKLRKGLSEAGLSKYQVNAYVTILELGTTQATTVAEKADIPRSRVYDVLRDLEDEGYVETFKQDSLSVRAREPSEVFSKLRSRANLLSETAAEIQDRWEQTSVGGHRISVFKRVDTVVKRAEEAIRNATNQVQLSLTPTQFERLSPALREAYADEVFVSVSFNESPHHPEELPPDSALADTVTEARHRNLPAPFLVLVDRDLTCYAPHERPIDQYGVVFEDPMLTYVFHWYFEAALWESWPVLFTKRSGSPPEEYVSIRSCIRDIAPVLGEGARITASIRGSKPGQRREVTLEGEVVDVLFASASDRSGPSTPTLSMLAGQATIVLETDDSEYGIGGWGALLEDIEAKRIVIESVRFPDEGESQR